MSASRPLNQLIPLLYPFFRHTIPNVRLSVVNTLHNFLSVPNFPDEWIDLFVMRLLMQNLVVEERLDVRDVTLQVWRLCITKLNGSPSRLQLTIGPLVRDWFTLIMAPLGTPMDASLFYHPRSGADQGHNVDKNMVLQDLSLVSSETILRARVVACRALAVALAVWSIEVSDAMVVYLRGTWLIPQLLLGTAGTLRCFPRILYEFGKYAPAVLGRDNNPRMGGRVWNASDYWRIHSHFNITSCLRDGGTLFHIPPDGSSLLIL